MKLSKLLLPLSVSIICGFYLNAMHKPTIHYSENAFEKASKELINIFENAKKYDKNTLYQKVQKALREGADPNTTKQISNRRMGLAAREYIPLDYKEIIPLHIAIELNYPELVQLLLRAGADRNLKNPEEMSALDLVNNPNVSDDIRSMVRGVTPEKLR